MLQEREAGQKSGGMAYVYIAWFFLFLQVLALMGILSQAIEHHEFRGMLSNMPSHPSAVILGLMLGSSFFAIAGLLLGLCAWGFRRNTAARPVVAVGVVLILMSTIVAFLLDTAAPFDSQQKHEATQVVDRLHDQWSRIVESSRDSQGLPKPTDTPINTTLQARRDLGETERLMSEFMAQMVSQRNDYMREIEGIGWNDILKANRIKGDPTFMETRATIQTAREIVKKYTERTNTLLSDTREKIRSLDVSEATQNEMVSGFDKGMRGGRQNIDTLWSLEAETIDEFENIIDLLWAKKEAWTVQGEQIRFHHNEDLEAFNAYIGSIQRMARQQQEIQSQSRQQVDRNFGQLREMTQ